MGGENLKMIAIARQFDAAAKFSGSGGAIVGLLTDESKKTKMKETFNKNGFVYLGLHKCIFPEKQELYVQT